MTEMAGQAMQSIEKALHTPMPFTAGGQTINDRLQAAKHSLAGSQLGKSICKATTEECIGPKKKHLDYLLHCSHEANVSIPQMANLLIERTQNQNWCVVFKSLVTIHNLMCYGSERFTQYLASCNADFNLTNFMDKTSPNGYEMSNHVKTYGRYISEKVYTYRLCAFDFCKVKRGKEDGLLRAMQADKLLKTLPILQGQIDALLEFQVSAGDLTNGIINSCFILLFRDLIRLFACYNDGIINLLGVLSGDMSKAKQGMNEKYFSMNKKNCREALDMYKKFLQRMDNVSEFLKVAEVVGIDKGEIPDLARAPNSLLEALEAHVAQMEGTSGGLSNAASPTAPQPANSFMSGGASTGGSQRIYPDINQQQQQQQQTFNPFAAPPPIPPQPQQHHQHQHHQQQHQQPFQLGAPQQQQQARSTPIDDLLGLDLGDGTGPAAAPAPPPATNGGSINPFAAVSQPPMHQQQPPPHPPPPNFNTTGNTPFNPYASQIPQAPGAPDPFQVSLPTSVTNVVEQQQQQLPKPPPPPRPPSVTARRTPEPPPISNTSFNPFLSDANPAPAAAGGAAPTPAWAPFNPTSTAPTSVADTTFLSLAGCDSGLPPPPPDSDSSNETTPIKNNVGNELRNPFGAFSQNTSALSNVDVGLGVGTNPFPTITTGGVPPPVSPSPEPFPPPTTNTTQPMDIPQQQNPANLGFYQTTPFSALDSSYTASPQIGRHVMGQNQGPKPKEKVIKGDLDSSLINLTQNLNLAPGQGPSKPVQYTGQPVMNLMTAGSVQPVQPVSTNPFPQFPPQQTTNTMRMDNQQQNQDPFGAL